MSVPDFVLGFAAGVLATVTVVRFALWAGRRMRVAAPQEPAPYRSREQWRELWGQVGGGAPLVEHCEFCEAGVWCPAHEENESSAHIGAAPVQVFARPGEPVPAHMHTRRGDDPDTADHASAVAGSPRRRLRETAARPGGRRMDGPGATGG